MKHSSAEIDNFGFILTGNKKDMNADAVLTTRLVQACANNLKIKFRLRSTPVGCYILFHPYSIFIDRQRGKEKIYGRVESHYYTNILNNALCCLSIDKIAEVMVLEVCFDKPRNWKRRIDTNRYRAPAWQQTAVEASEQ